MLESITTEAALEDFFSFWQTHFPEQSTLTREAVLTQIDDRQRGYANIAASDEEMIPYQNDRNRPAGRQATASVDKEAREAAEFYTSLFSPGFML